MSDNTVTANLVVLPSATWASELAAELVRLGVDPGRAPASARHVLHRICAHHGWPREVIEVAGAAADDLLDTGPAIIEAET